MMKMAALNLPEEVKRPGLYMIELPETIIPFIMRHQEKENLH